MDNQTPITDEWAAFAQDVVAVCRKHGVAHIHVSQLTVGFHGPMPTGHFSFHWSAGRHGDDSQITIKSEATRHVKEKNNDAC